MFPVCSVKTFCFTWVRFSLLRRSLLPTVENPTGFRQPFAEGRNLRLVNLLPRRISRTNRCSCPFHGRPLGDNWSLRTDEPPEGTINSAFNIGLLLTQLNHGHHSLCPCVILCVLHLQCIYKMQGSSQTLIRLGAHPKRLTFKVNLLRKTLL